MAELRDPRCGRRPSEIFEFVDAAASEECTPDEFVRENEGTLNRTTGEFLCTECYIAIGMPTSPRGWTVPAGVPWAASSQSEEARIEPERQEVNRG